MNLTEIINSSSPTVADNLGMVHLHQNRVFRVVKNTEYQVLYKDLLEGDSIEKLFDLGLVKTSILTTEELDGIENHLVLEHQKIPYILHPSEYTNLMFWKSAKMFLKLAIELADNGFVFKDAHPWNTTYYRDQPVFLDFTSIIKQDHITKGFLFEFAKYYGFSIKMASSRTWNKYATEYRREHGLGFGHQMFSSKWGKAYLADLYLMKRHLKEPKKFYKKLLKWVEKNKPKINKEYWSSYNQGHEANFKNPKTIKQLFVHDVISKTKPASVIDLACNKGYYAAVAAHLNAEVMAFDYEPYCVDQCIDLAKKEKLNITSAVMNFFHPTARSGWGLGFENSFERLNSNIALALGLIHHICIRQKMPVHLFCEIIKKYSSDGVIVEFVDPTDKHVALWNEPMPENYSIEGLKTFFKDKFPHSRLSDELTDGGIKRQIIYFSKKAF